jgi:hypothetical protein
MYLFKIFGVFPSDYWNGFADGSTFIAVLYGIRALCVFFRKAEKFRFEFTMILRNVREGRSSLEEMDRLLECINNNWQLTECEKNALTRNIAPIRSFLRQPFQSRYPESLVALGELEKFAFSGSLDTFARFKAQPVQAVCLAVIHAAWFGRE